MCDTSVISLMFRAGIAKKTVNPTVNLTNIKWLSFDGGEQVNDRSVSSDRHSPDTTVSKFFFLLLRTLLID